MSASPQLLLVQDEVPGEIAIQSGLIAILGNSGSGKSTLLRLLQSALVSGRTISSRQGTGGAGSGPVWYVADELVTQGGQPLVVTPQENTLVLPGLTALENVLHYLSTVPWCRAHKPRVLASATDGDLSNPEIRARTALSVVDLGDKAETSAGGLSGGEKRRLLLAMDLALGPRVLVADEPLSQLDSSSASKVFGALLEQAKEGPVLFTVHQPIDEWLEGCDQVWIVERGCRVAAAMPGVDLVRTADRMSLGDAEDATLHDIPTLRNIVAKPEQMSLVKVMETARHLFGKEGEGGQPAAYRVLARLKSPTERNATLAALRQATVSATFPQVEVAPRPPVDESPSGPRFAYTVRHYVGQDFGGNLKSGLYWLMLSLFIGVTFFTNFFGGANELPFAIPLATNALLVSVLFVSTVSGVKVWTGPAGDRIRQLLVRGASLPTVLVAKAAPALLEATLIAALALIGTWVLESRGVAPGWPDAFSNLAWAPSIPTVVPLMMFVGLVGWAQGATISLLMAVHAQRSALRHFSAPRAEAAPKPKRRGGAVMEMDPVQRAYSLAVLLVVGQIGLGGAFGQITSGYVRMEKEAATLVVDGMGSLSPLRWAYNAALISEWRQTRCRVRHEVGRSCETSLPSPKLANECVPGGLADDTFRPSQMSWKDINDPACGRVESERRPDGSLEPDRRHTVALYFQAGGTDADRLDRLLERRRLLDERQVLLPAQAVTQAFASQSYARLNDVRKRPGGEELACYQREANVDYLYNLGEMMVAKGMIRPSLIDVEWCWKNCPDVREAKGVWQDGRLSSLAADGFMMRECPNPGEEASGDVMKHFFRPAVTLLDSSSRYPCRDLAHELFVEPQRFASLLGDVCEQRVVMAAEKNILFWMLAVALGWASAALFLAFAWSSRVARGA